MHIKAITSKGITRLYIYETIYERDPVTGKGRTRSKLIEPLGRLDELQKVYDDPIAHFKAVCEQRTSAEKEKQKISLEIDLDEQMPIGEDSFKNVGYVSDGKTKFPSPAQKRQIKWTTA